VTARATPRRDPVDDLIDQWRKERPDLELGPMAVFGRLGRLHALASRAIEAVFEQHGLNIGEFDVLAALRRSGAPYEQKPSRLASTLMLSPAGMTDRLDRLERAGMVHRRPDPDDRRSWIVGLTDQGRTAVDAAVADHVANEARLLDPLSATERRTLDRLLRALLAGFER
jgi:DNA-binding MarR family transcriptional regulator